MKQYLLKPCKLFVCISLILFLPKRSFGQLNGNYTINPAKAASSSNYKNWASAVSDLTSGSRTDGGNAQGAGVSGPVTFSVYDTVYATNIAITPVSGTSYTNRITFKSAKGDSSKCTLQYASSSSPADDYVVLLNGADYITFSKIGFERTGTNNPYSTVIQITNTAQHNKFINCRMLGVKQPSNKTNGSHYGIGSCVYVPGNADSLELNNNKMIYGYNGVFASGITGSGTGMRILRNTIDTCGSSGILVTYCQGLKIIGNTINLGDFGSTSGHFSSFGISIESSTSFEISKNKIFSMAVNAQSSLSINISGGSGTKLAPALVSNNFVLNYGGKSSCIGLFTNGGYFLYYFYNNVLITSSLSNGCAYYLNPNMLNTHIKLKNNNLINKGGGYVFNSPGSPAGDYDTSNYNNLYTTGSIIGTWGSSSYSNIVTWRSGTNMDSNSMSVDPGFKSNGNLHISNYALKGKGYPCAVKDDIDGDARDASTPDIGADEITPVPNDAGMAALIKPMTNACVGLLDVQAVIKNYGTNKLTRANINWSVNGIAQTPYSWTGSLLSNKMDTVILGFFNFTDIPNPRFILKTSMPNGTNDSDTHNDSLIVVRTLRSPPAVNLGADFSLCLGDSVTIGPVNNPTNSYKWLNISGGTIGTTSQITVRPSSVTSYILEVKSISYGCVNRDTVTVNINSKPVADAGPDQAICSGASAKLGKPAQSGFTYNWTSSPSGLTSTAANPTVSPTVTTTYTFGKTETSTGCKGTDVCIVTVNLPNTPLITGIKTPCRESTMSYTTKADSGNSYLWNVAKGQILGGQNTNTIIVQWKAGDTGYVKVEETNATTCKDSNIYLVIVSPKPVAGYSVTGTCKGSTTMFTDVSTGASSFNWTFSDGGTSTLTNPTRVFGATGTYTTRQIVQNSLGCADTTSRQFTIQPLPVAAFSITKSYEKRFDFKDSSTISAGTISAWQWDFGDNRSSISQNVTHQYLSEGNITVKLCVTSIAGCSNCTTKNLNVVGLFAPAFHNKISAVPNPGSCIFNITSWLSVVSVVITNISGQIIGTYQPFSNMFNIDLSQQPEGIYFVRVVSDNGNGVLKLVKQ